MTRIRRLKNGDISEESIHLSLMEWIAINPLTKPYKDFFLHYPSEGKRSPRYGKLMKDLGMRKGVSDLFIAIPRHGYGGAWIELKSACGNLKKEQKQFLEDMHQQNFFASACWSFDDAVKVIAWYFNI